MHQPKVLISVLNWQHYQNTIECVYSLLNSDFKNFEIIIIDNNSPNDSYNQLVNTFPDLRIIKSKSNNGYASGHKISVEIAINANAELIWVLNNDLLVENNSLSELINAYLAKKEAIYGSITLQSKNPDIVDFGGGLSPKNEDYIFSFNLYKGCKFNDLPSEEIREVQSVEGSSMLIPVSVIKKYGFMKTDFFMYGEETDYCLRMKKHGICSFVVRSSLVLHKNAGSFEGSEKISIIPAYYRRRNYIRLLKEHYGWSIWKCMNYPESFLLKNKFLIKCLVKSGFKENNLVDYYRLMGSFDGAFGRKSKRIDTNNLL